MRRWDTWVMAALLAVAIAPATASATTRLELGLLAEPTVVLDPAFEAFSRKDLLSARLGVDLRLEHPVGAGFKLVPLIAYRGAYDEGEPYDAVENELWLHDLLLGLRLRKGLTAWLGAFAELRGGVVFWDLETAVADGWSGGEASATDGADSGTTWAAGALAGLELRISRSWLRSRGVRRFGFGGEVGAGYLWRGAIEPDPSIEPADEHALPVESAAPWGEVDLSGWMIQAGLVFSFL